MSNLLTFLHFALFMVVQNARASWTRVLKKAPWAARSDPQLALLNETLFLMGGHQNSNYYNDVWTSSDGGLTWVEQPAAPWAPRSYHTAKVMGDFIYLVAGHDAKTWFNDVWRTRDGREWEQITANADFCPRAASALQVVNGTTLLLMGGSDGLLKPIGKGKCFNDVWRSDNGGKNWSLVTENAPWPAREGLQKLTTVRSDGTIIMTAGESGYFGPYYHDVWTTVDGIEWTAETSDAGFSARSGNLLAKGADGSIFTFATPLLLTRRHR